MLRDNKTELESSNGQEKFFNQHFTNAGAALTYSFMSKVEAFVGHENIPLLLAPSHTETILYAINDDYGGYQLYLGKHPLDDQVPDVK